MFELLRKNKAGYYWKGKRGREVDFLIRKGLNIEMAIQVCFDPEDEKTVQREINALDLVMQEYEIKDGLIITMNEAKLLKKRKRVITFIPLYEWLLS